MFRPFWETHAIAFSTGFNRTKKVPWGLPEWKFFRDDLKTYLQRGGKIFFALNPERKAGRYYSNELRDFFLSRGAELERERTCLSAALAPRRPGSSETRRTG